MNPGQRWIRRSGFSFLSPALLLGSALAPALPARAGLLFEDGFELGTFCPWDFPPTGFEVANGLDDDCDGEIDEAAPICDIALPSNASDPLQYAAALGLCQTTTEAGHDWGVISAALTLADGTGAVAAVSRSIRGQFGDGNAPLEGARLAVLATGNAAATGQTNPGHAAFQSGENTGTHSPAPADWLAANGGSFPNAPGCPEPAGGTTAHNPAMLTLRLRVPGNASSFRFSAHFLSAEYPEWVCSPYSDFFVALLESTFPGTPANPLDRNLAVVATESGSFPVGTNLASDDSGLFTQCENGTIGCTSPAVLGTITTCVGPAGLANTGFHVANPPGEPGEPGFCDSNNLTGGGTGWMTVRGNVVPGENVTLRIATWDTGDSILDSVLLLDAFAWSTATAIPGTTID